MGFIVSIGVLLVAAYLLCATLQSPQILKPYLMLFAGLGLLLLLGLGLGGELGMWGVIAVKFLAALTSLVLCVRLAVLVYKKLPTSR